MTKRHPGRAKGVRPTSAAEPAAPGPVPADASAELTMLDRARSQVGAPPAPSREQVMQDLEAAKRLAFEGINVAGGVRAIELQGKSVGAFDPPEPLAVEEASDEAIIEMLAAGCEPVAEILRWHRTSGNWKGPLPDHLTRHRDGDKS